MRSTILTIIIALSSFCSLNAQKDYTITWDYHNQSFKDFTARVEENFPVRFFYKDEWVNDLKITFYRENISLRELLSDLFSGLSLYYFIDDNGNIVITKNFAVRLGGDQTSDNKSFIPPTEYYDTHDSIRSSGNLFYEIGNPAEKNKPGNVIVSGYITDRDTKEPVAGATVYVQKLSTGTFSNQYGYYSLSLPRGVHLVQFSFIGMKEKDVDLNLYGQGEMNVEMQSVLIPLKEAVVSARKNMTLQRYEAGMEKVNIATAALMPSSLGEVDIFKNFLMLPGVQSVGEGSAGFNVRGGSADQNLILLYDAPIYNSSHFFGFFSAVNSDIIKDVTLYKGGIPARYGGRISSVIDIAAKDGSRKEFAGNAGISPVTAHMTIEGPLIKDTLYYILAARTTYSNWLFRLFDDPSLQKSRASFYDFNGRITYDVSKTDKIDLSSYLSHDSFRFNTDTTYMYDNNIISLKWRHFFTNRFFSQFIIDNSYYKYNISSESSVYEGFILSHMINSTGLKADFNLYRGRHELNFGLDATRYSVSPGTYLPASDSSLVIPRTIMKERALEAAIYIDDKFVLTDYLSVNAGIRLSSFFSMGPSTVLLYNPEFSKKPSTVIDTVQFRAGKILATRGGPEFRVSLNFRPARNSSLKLNYNRTMQYLHLLSNTASISPTDIWKLSDYHLKPQSGDQFALGYYQVLFRGGIEASVEVYYKRIRNMVDFRGGSNLIMQEHIEQDLVNVRGKAYGMEFSIKKNEGKARWNIGYIYARTFLQSTSKFTDEMINGGKWFPANYDKPHDLVASFSYLLSRRLSFSTNYTWSTGRPITYPVATYRLGDIVIVHYSDRNKYRIPNYMRLDASLVINGNLKSRKIAHPQWTFSVYNLLGRENVYSVYFENNDGIIRGYKLSVFGRAIPSVTFSFDF
jgi:hypothetical protein